MYKAVNKAPEQKAAFLISWSGRRVTPIENPKPRTPLNKIISHDFPLVIIPSVSEVIEFLSRYTDIVNVFNNDRLLMKQELKNACFILDITDEARLDREIIAEDFYGVHRSTKEIYDEHYLHVHRLPIGIVKRYIPSRYF